MCKRELIRVVIIMFFVFDLRENDVFLLLIKKYKIFYLFLLGCRKYGLE